MTNKLILIAMLVIPWFSLFFMKRESIKYYMPVGIFTALMTTITYEAAYEFNWWINHVKLVPWGHITNTSYAYGAFLILTIWIFYFTYRKFWLYLTVNIVFNAIQWFIIHGLLFEKRNLVTFENITEFQVFLLGIAQSLIIYGYQKWQEGSLKKVNSV